MTFDVNTSYVGQTLLCFDELGCTNDYLKEHASTLPSGAVVLAASQTNGRGRLGRSWQDPTPGRGLAMSVLLRPNLQPEQTALLPLITGMAVLEALESLLPAAYGIKWPNDLVLGGKKICGILCESQWGLEPYSVLGIGVNLLQDAAYFERSGLPNATSVWLQTGERLSIRPLCVAICRALEPLLDCLEQKGFSALRQAYKARCLNIGRKAQVSLEGRKLEGTVLDVDGEGRLVVRFEAGVRAIRSGEASVRGLYGYL